MHTLTYLCVLINDNLNLNDNLNGMLIDTISLDLLMNTAQWQEHGNFVLHDNFFMLKDFKFQEREFLMPTQPYLLREGRFVYVRQGWADYSFDLVDYHFVAGDIVIFHAETLIEKRKLSPDFEIDAFTFVNTAPATSNFTCVHPDETRRPTIEAHIALLWELVRQEPFPTECVTLLTQSMLTYVATLETKQEAGHTRSRKDETLRRFISLVSRHAGQERNIGYYADRLCLAPHYLSTLIKQSSGATPMQWINKTAIKEIKVWLAYSDETTAQIADRLNFPCPSSLTKFFKRETGMTPTEYRRGHPENIDITT